MRGIQNSINLKTVFLFLFFSLQRRPELGTGIAWFSISSSFTSFCILAVTFAMEIATPSLMYLGNVASRPRPTQHRVLAEISGR